MSNKVINVKTQWSNGAMPIPVAQNQNIVNIGELKLNEEQQAVLQSVVGRKTICSNPGTGKTTLLVSLINRIRQLYPESSIMLAVTFSKKAAQDLSDRIGLMAGVTVSTFHSLAYRILKSSSVPFKLDSSTANAESTIASLIGKHDTTVREVVNSLHKLDGFSKGTSKVRQLYLDNLRERHIVTFDTMLLEALRLLQTNMPLRRYWSSAFDFVLLDEAQDQSSPQSELVDIIAEQSNNLTVCADEKQGIYGFRGAVPNIMDSYKKGADIYDLTINYRSTQPIINLANEIMAEYKPMIAANTAPATPPKFITAADAIDEAKIVCNEIQRLYNEGMALKDMAVLFRSSSVTNSIVNELLEHQIPFYCKSNVGTKYSQRPYSVILDIFNFMANANSKETMKEILPIMFIRKHVIEEIAEIAKEQQRSLIDTLTNCLVFKPAHNQAIKDFIDAVIVAAKMSPAAAVRHLLKHGLAKYLGMELMLSVENIITELEEFTDIPSFLQHVKEVKEQAAETRKLAAQSDDCLNLMTIHASKGLEFRAVFIIGATDGILPSSRDGADLAEEKRLAYVAVTRAKNLLYISYPRQSANSLQPNKPCRFFANHFTA